MRIYHFVSVKELSKYHMADGMDIGYWLMLVFRGWLGEDDRNITSTLVTMTKKLLKSMQVDIAATDSVETELLARSMLRHISKLRIDGPFKLQADWANLNYRAQLHKLLLLDHGSEEEKKAAFKADMQEIIDNMNFKCISAFMTGLYTITQAVSDAHNE